MISSNLKSNDNTNKMLRQPCALYAIKRTFYSIPLATFRLLFCSNVRPILEYDIQATFYLTQGEPTSLECVQHCETRLVQEMRGLPYHDHLNGMHNLRYEHDVEISYMLDPFFSGYIGDHQSFFALHKINFT